MARRRFGIFRRDAGEDGQGASHDRASDDSASLEPPTATAVFDRLAAGDDDFSPPGSADPGEPEDLPPASAWALGFDPATPAADEQPWPVGNGVVVEDESATADERVRAAARRATEAAEQRAMDEILALERDLETARSESRQELDAAQALLAEAERRAAEAEEALARLRSEPAATTEAADDPERIRLEAEDRARAAAAGWLRKQLELAREESDERLAEAVDAARTEAETRADAEIARVNQRSDQRLQEIEQRALAAAERFAAAEEKLAREAERLKARAATLPTPTRAEPVLAPTRPEPAKVQRPPAAAPSAPSNGKLSLSRADLVTLRELGMSVTQAKRVLRYRDERGTIASVDELDAVPGFPRPFLEELKQRLEP